MKPRKLIPIGLAAAALGSAAFWMPDVTADWLNIGKADGDHARVEVDNTPLDRESRSFAPTSYASVIERVAPSVVNIVSTRSAKHAQQNNPLLNDPFFRRYFDLPEGQAPPQQRRAPRQRDQQSLGSGVIISADGYIVTNNHVIEGADEIRVLLGDNSQEYTATLVGTDPKSDIALLKIEGEEDFPAVTLGNSDELKVGDVVFAIGNPMGVGQTVTQGIISAQGRAIGIVDYEDFIQTDAAINPGNSGGALIDAQGRLIGINTAIVSRSGGNMGIGFAVPVNQARFTMESLLTDGRVARGFLGVTIQDIDHELQAAFGLPDMEGALVNNVMPEGSAGDAGVQNGDVIRSFNGRKIRDVRHLRMLVSGTSPGTDVEFKVWRDGQLVTLDATLKELPSDEVASLDPGAQEAPAADLMRGVSVEVYDAQRHAQLQLPKGRTGLVVTEVTPDSPAAASGLQPGDLISQINRHDVRGVKDAKDALKSGQSDRILLYVYRGGTGRFMVISNDG